MRGWMIFESRSYIPYFCNFYMILPLWFVRRSKILFCVEPRIVFLYNQEFLYSNTTHANFTLSPHLGRSRQHELSRFIVRQPIRIFASWVCSTRQQTTRWVVGGEFKSYFLSGCTPRWRSTKITHTSARDPIAIHIFNMIIAHAQLSFFRKKN